MTTAKVVDASALAALLFGEPEADAVVGRLANARLVAPCLLGFELANVCLVKSRRYPSQRAALLAAFRLCDRLGVKEIAIDQESTLALAIETGMTVYDASYLWLAQRLGAELVTLDQQLLAATTAQPHRQGSK